MSSGSHARYKYGKSQVQNARKVMGLHADENIKKTELSGRGILRCGFSWHRRLNVLQGLPSSERESCCLQP